MIAQSETVCIAFEGSNCIAAGDLRHVVPHVKQVLDRGERAPVLIFDDVTSEQIELDFRGTLDDILKRLPALEPAPITDSKGAELVGPRGPGRPKLGVVAREVTLLPRHWEWLNDQPGGASVALRKLVEEARRANADRDRRRQAEESAYRFLSALAGNLAGFEAATRALFTGQQTSFEQLTEAWPKDIRTHAQKIAIRAFQNPAGA